MRAFSMKILFDDLVLAWISLMEHGDFFAKVSSSKDWGYYHFPYFL